MPNNPYTQKTIIDYINTLKGVQGYIQMSNKPIENIWREFDDISFEPSSGFVYEAHFWSEAEKKSIAIKQINSEWLVDEVEDVPLSDTQVYFAKNDLKVKMAQIWEEEKYEHCEGMPVLKLKKVVFAGFEK